MSHRLCKDVAPYCHCRGCKLSSAPVSGSNALAPRALCPPWSPQGARTSPGNSLSSDALCEQRRTTRRLSHEEHARKPRRRRAQQQLCCMWPLQKTKHSETRLQWKEGKRRQQFLKRTHQRQQLFLPCSHQSPIYTPRVETGKRTTTLLPFGESQIPCVISPPRPDGLWELTSCANPALTRAPKTRSVQSACRTSSRGKPNILKNHPHFWDSDLQTGT